MTRSYLIKIFFLFRSWKIWRILIIWLRSILPSVFRGMMTTYLSLIRGFNPVISVWFHFCKEFTTCYYTMMSILQAIPIGSISKFGADSRDATSSSYLIMVKLGLCIIRVLRSVYMMIKMGGGEVVRILCVSIIGGFIRKGLILILIVCLFSTNFRRIIV